MPRGTVDHCLQHTDLIHPLSLTDIKYKKKLFSICKSISRNPHPHISHSQEI